VLVVGKAGAGAVVGVEAAVAGVSAVASAPAASAQAAAELAATAEAANLAAQEAAESGVAEDLACEVEARVTGALENHHQLPEEFLNEFRRAGLDIENYVIQLAKAAHRLRPDGLHTGRGVENWNGAWREFFERATTPPTKQEILDQLSKLRKVSGLE
jgi:hypothetical protein